jgi:hypothetical protein
MVGAEHHAEHCCLPEELVLLTTSWLAELSMTRGLPEATAQPEHTAFPKPTVTANAFPLLPNT